MTNTNLLPKAVVGYIVDTISERITGKSLDVIQATGSPLGEIPDIVGSPVEVCSLEYYGHQYAIAYSPETMKKDRAPIAMYFPEEAARIGGTFIMTRRNGKTGTLASLEPGDTDIIADILRDGAINLAATLPPSTDPRVSIWDV